ncbi:MAG: hypothetical protein V3T39_04190 [Gammaproteobacteria bacterium]
MSEILRLPRTLADQLLCIATQRANQHGIGRIYLSKNGKYFCAEPGSPRNVERDDALFALFQIYANVIDTPDASIISTIQKPTVLLTITLGTKGVLEIRAWDCKSGAAEERELEIFDI